MTHTRHTKKLKLPALYDNWRLYDAIFRDTDQELRFLGSVFSVHFGRVERVMEPGCGTGRLLVPLAQSGYSVLGFDISESAVRRARREVVKPRAAALWTDDMRSFRLPAGHYPVDAAYSLTCSVNEISTGKGLANHFAAMARAIRPGGIYCFDVYTGPANVELDRGAVKLGGRMVGWSSTMQHGRKRPDGSRVLDLVFRADDKPMAPIKIYQRDRETFAELSADWFDVIASYSGRSLRVAGEEDDVVSLVLRRNERAA